MNCREFSYLYKIEHLPALLNANFLVSTCSKTQIRHIKSTYKFSNSQERKKVNVLLHYKQIKVADAEGKDVSFRKLLLNRCQKEFEKEKENEREFSEKFGLLEGSSV